MSRHECARRRRAWVLSPLPKSARLRQSELKEVLTLHHTYHHHKLQSLLSGSQLWSRTTFPRCLLSCTIFQSVKMSTETRSLFQHLPPPAECLALVIGTLELLPFGIIGLRNPAFFADGYGLPISNAPTSEASSSTKPNPSGLSPEAEQQTKKALVAAIAARNVQNGILLLTFGLVLRDRRSLGVAILAGLVATVADTVIVRAYGVKDKIAGHYVGVFNSLAVGGSLLYWGRNDPLW